MIASRQRSFSITSFALLKCAQRSQEIDAPEGGPIDVGEIELAEHALPQQESGKPYLPAGADNEVRVGKIRRIEVTADRLGRDEINHVSQRLSSCKLLAKQPSDRVHNLLASAVGSGNRQMHAVVIFGGSFGRLQDCESRGRQQLEPADRAHLHLSTEKTTIAREALELLLDRGENSADFLGRSVAVVGRQHPQCNRRNPELHAPLQQVVELVGAGGVDVFRTTQVILPGKPSIAVEDQADMARERKGFDLAQQPMLIGSVSRGEQPTTAL